MLDAAIVLVLALFVLGGWRRGLILELGAVAAFFAGLALAATFWTPAAQLLKRAITNETGAAVVAFVLLFVAGYAVVIFAAGLARTAARLMLLGWIDRIGGLLIGLLKGAFVVELGLLALARLPLAASLHLVPGSAIAALFQSQQAGLFRLIFGAFTSQVPFFSKMF